ncbi:tetratricopeptide TPR2 repeat-containing protein [Leptospira ryugenii]|uniref:Tetratricopeptide TPR2 repeat-containing protein n=1 Tax=Leptospira ryugenii TaxID=1917863 RepID=A0A2P2DV98_9LEPT|nr:tetratricopeptide repeat protein [Leptospira ryugenii]GBF48520.1 tetratricopeptide TPR2 repeat-containing protein [Leptospira ryugenii]
MNLEIQFEKIEVYFKQKNFSKAEKELSAMLSQNPREALIFIYFAQLYNLKKEYPKGHVAIDNALAISPNDPYAFNIKSILYYNQQKYSEAEKYIKKAIELVPEFASYHGHLAEIKIQRKQFNDALEIANLALSIDPEDTLALNARSQALVKLNRNPEAFKTIEGALRNDPNDPYTHANYGWGLLEAGDYKKAQMHFKEALTQDPNFEYAKEGLSESLKATYFIYRIFLKYSFFISNQTAKFQWMYFLGFFLLVRSLKTIAKLNENLQFFIYPILVVLGIFAFSTWLIPPIANLILRLHPLGLHLLNPKEKWSANFVAVSLFLFFSGILLCLFFQEYHFASLSIIGFCLIAPLGNMFQSTKYPKVLPIYACILLILGMSAISLSLVERELFNVFTMVFVFLFIGFTWLYNFLVIGQNEGS